MAYNRRSEPRNPPKEFKKLEVQGVDTFPIYSKSLYYTLRPCTTRDLFTAKTQVVRVRVSDPKAQPVGRRAGRCRVPLAARTAPRRDAGSRPSPAVAREPGLPRAGTVAEGRVPTGPPTDWRRAVEPPERWAPSGTGSVWISCATRRVSGAVPAARRAALPAARPPPGRAQERPGAARAPSREKHRRQPFYRGHPHLFFDDDPGLPGRHRRRPLDWSLLLLPVSDTTPAPASPARHPPRRRPGLAACVTPRLRSAR